MREKSASSAMAKMRKGIFAEVSTLETTMKKLYDKFVIVHKAVFHLHWISIAEQMVCPNS